jgi:hypothetical protein
VEIEMFFVIKAKITVIKAKIAIFANFNDIFQKNDKSVVMMLSHRKLRELGFAHRPFWVLVLSFA